jgi:flagellar protein FliS
MNPYLRTKILTASPQELRLLLYEGAIKFCRQSHHALGQNNYEAMFNALQRAQKIVLELGTSLRRDVEPELTDRLSALYDYIYRRLVDANMERDSAAIDECIELLEYQKTTWQMLLSKLQAEKADQAGGDEAPAPQPAEVPNPIGRIDPHAAAPAPRFTAQG